MFGVELVSGDVDAVAVGAVAVVAVKAVSSAASA